MHPYAIAVMQEIGIDISQHEAKSIERFKGISFDWVITVCDQAQESCPFFPGATNVLHKSFPDPVRYNESPMQALAQFRRVRDDILEWIQKTFRKEPL